MRVSNYTVIGVARDIIEEEVYDEFDFDGEYAYEELDDDDNYFGSI